MLVLSFWSENFKEILISSLFFLLIAGLLVILSIIQSHEKRTPKTIIISLIIIVVILLGVSYAIAYDFLSDGKPLPIGDIAKVDFLIVFAYCGITFLIIKSHRQKTHEKQTTKIAVLSLLIAMSSVLMMMSIPIFPQAPFLKLELSGLVIFMVLLWYDFKTAIVVSLLTNFIHVFLPSSTAPLILFLDESINFIATMCFLLPGAIMFRNFNNQKKPSSLSVILSSVIGVLFTLVFMVLYNHFINLPLVYHQDFWTFKQVLTIFGLFNLIKWGAVAMVINVLWKRLYNLKYVGN
ncbi:MAG: ECF transporter S component [Bacilli bacterium]